MPLACSTEVATISGTYIHYITYYSTYYVVYVYIYSIYSLNYTF